MARGRLWTSNEIDRLIDMRDRRKMKWADIAAVLRRPSGNACFQAYRDCGGMLRDEEDAAPRPIFDDDTPPPLPAAVTRSLDEPMCRPRYFSDIDADLIARISRQGLTAGYFGDPPPGRSALDQRVKEGLR